MALYFYDSTGRPYAYSDDGGHNLHLRGKANSLHKRRLPFSFSGRHLCFFENGQIWDHSGAVVLFTDEASSGPMKPLKTLKPLKGLKGLKPIKGVKELKPLKALKGLSWSSSVPEQIFET